MPTILYELIKHSEKGDQKATLEIIKKFTPILRKYSKKLSYDGSETDLIIALIETIDYISRIDNIEIADNEGCIIGYINKSIKHKYIKLSKSWSDICKYELELGMAAEVFGKDIIHEKDNYISLKEMLDKLPSLQKKVIKERFIMEKSCSEIAIELGISRQAVNNLKNRALKSLKTNKETYVFNE